MSVLPPDERGVEIPLSLVAHTAFCPRRAWLEAVGERADSVAIEAGTQAHQRVDARSDDRATARRSVDVGHEELGLVGRCDVVEDAGHGQLQVVEYKSAPIRRRPVVTRPQALQLALQGICLESMGHEVTSYAVHFTSHNTTVAVDVGGTEKDEALALVEQTRRIVAAEHAPPPLEDDPRCTRCSHAGVCLPDERAETLVRRQVRVPDPDGDVLHLTTPGSRASLSRGRIRVARGSEDLGSVPLERVAGLVVHGNVDVSGALLREMMWRRLAVIWCSGRGRVVGYATSAETPNGLPRQLQRAMSGTGQLPLAREFISAKVANQATQLRRSSRDDVASEVSRLRRLARECLAARSVNELLGYEGEAAAVYFSRWPAMLTGEGGAAFARAFPGRVGRGALDEVNIALNFVYGLLLGEVVRAVLACGLDPHAGFVHSPSRNKPALALDLMEQFRPVIADSVVVGAINNGELRPKMFTSVLGGARLRDNGRKALVATYERRVQQEITHPVFGYRTSWRRAMEIQARMVLGVLDGSQDRYVGIRTR